MDQAMEEDTIAFVRREGARARYVTSVCTGAFILGAAGLLRGKRATTHWALHHLLPRVGAIPVKERVVRGGNTFTGGGVTAGVDFAFVVLSEIAGPVVAPTVQLGIEYDPKPPFVAGSPTSAPAEIKAKVDRGYERRCRSSRKYSTVSHVGFEPRADRRCRSGTLSPCRGTRKMGWLLSVSQHSKGMAMSHIRANHEAPSD
jgi:cyclohexyl-isocyanide hydratase